MFPEHSVAGYDEIGSSSSAVTSSAALWLISSNVSTKRRLLFLRISVPSNPSIGPLQIRTLSPIAGSLKVSILSPSGRERRNSTSELGSAIGPLWLPTILRTPGERNTEDCSDL